MRVFVTGATGFIGSAVTEELMQAGHTVTALARSEAAAKALSAKGIQPLLGNLDDMECLRSAAASADGVIHLAFMHGPSQIPFWPRMGVIFGGSPTGIPKRFMAVASEADRRAIDTFGAALKGSGRPLVTTFGTMGLSHVGFRAAKPAMIREAVAQRVDARLFALSYDFVGDLAETAALVWPARPGANAPPTLASVVEELEGAGGTGSLEQDRQLLLEQQEARFR